MNTYERMKQHLEKHMYKRGRNKGDAPADSSRRAKTNFRVIDRGPYMAVRLWATDIVRAYPDGRLMIDCDGWLSHSTTKINLARALYWFAGISYSSGIPHSKSVFSYSQLVMEIGGKVIRYYDGIKLQESESGVFTVTSELKPFEATRIDRVESKAFMDGVKNSGFKNLFNILHATCPEFDGRYSTTHYNLRRLEEIITDADCADKWAELVAYHSWTAEYKYTPNGMQRTLVKLPAPTVWSNIMSRIKNTMYRTVTTEVYEINE